MTARFDSTLRSAVKGTKNTQRFGYCLPEQYTATLTSRKEEAKLRVPHTWEDAFEGSVAAVHDTAAGAKRAAQVFRVAWEKAKRKHPASETADLTARLEGLQAQAQLLARDASGSQRNESAREDDSAAAAETPQRAAGEGRDPQVRGRAAASDAAKLDAIGGRLCSTLAQQYMQQAELQRSVARLQLVTQLVGGHGQGAGAGLKGHELTDFEDQVRLSEAHSGFILKCLIWLACT